MIFARIRAALRLADLCAGIWLAMDDDDRLRKTGSPEQIRQSAVDLDRLFRARQRLIEQYAERWGRR